MSGSAWTWFVCALLGHKGTLHGGPFAVVLHCDRCHRDLRVGVD